MKFKIGYLFMVIGIIMFSIFVYGVLTLEYGEEEVDCYDRWNNEIIGETCIEVTDSEDALIYFMFSLVILIAFVFMGVMINVSDDMYGGDMK